MVMRQLDSCLLRKENTMKVRVEFNKVFTDGILKGITVRQKLTCVSMDEALDWVLRVENNIGLGLLDFYINQVEYVALLEDK
jgi:hypothetical protein